MNISEYARYRKSFELPGGTRTAVYKAIKTGRISISPTGQIDPEIADREWLKNSNTSIMDYLRIGGNYERYSAD